MRVEQRRELDRGIPKRLCGEAIPNFLSDLAEKKRILVAKADVETTPDHAPNFSWPTCVSPLDGGRTPRLLVAAADYVRPSYRNKLNHNE